MERIKEAAKVLKLYPKLPLGVKTEKGIVSTGPHLVKLLGEPTTVMVNKGGKQVRAFKFLVEENDITYKWLVPLTNADGSEGHYLVDRLNTLDVQVGDTLILEMKKRGPKNYVEVLRPGEAGHEDDEVEEGAIDPASIGFDGVREIE